MIFHRLGSINRKQRGFTLIELVIALAITGAITGGITMSIFQTLDYNARSNARMIAVKQVENAIHYINRDVQMAQIVDTADPDPDGDGFPLTLRWVEWDAYNTEHVVTYSKAGDELKRNHTEDGVSNETTVAWYLDTDPANTHCAFDETEWIFTLKITTIVRGYPEDISEMREMRTTPRTS
jgi:prepilin-type N-terminal cleavage/methylation domain-containing protein